MKNAEAIKWAMNNEAEYDFTLEAPNTRDNEGNPISINFITTEGYQLKLQIDQHHKDKQLYKSNKKQHMDTLLDNVHSQWKMNWKPEKIGRPLKTIW